MANEQNHEGNWAYHARCNECGKVFYDAGPNQPKPTMSHLTPRLEKCNWPIVYDRIAYEQDLFAQ